ncbi:hypothetical protein SPRG_19559 [Saprolegnia parasitica CBS 223.65]|uniref:Uncharacterized protein n=1 Tax=Saprolegnia parasitica (strain CBS 223.65) TaxID=695850 RepID=A0A067CKE3_SAPPC|nr:hypothetical protein SPRG_19559 [Saprolegnia parasitica CBS 223.65]KDO31003.1 hypothetical protein SPRG_19559 [Saprolegnia parasitica CBS 223.65]|eukprot:XP_012198296.1 hypothetical protein SPRG_19559 [Saprolegnia parasitica CBS 223.65]
MQRGESKIRYDPTDHAKKQLAAKERAKELRDARQRGVVNEACTFAPKVNPRREADNNHEEPSTSAPPGSPPIRSKFNATQPPPSPPIKSKFQATAQRDASPPPSPPKRQASTLRKPNNQRVHANDSSDSLDSLAGNYSRPTSKSKAAPLPEPEEPQHDALSYELKSRTGKAIPRESKPKAAAAAAPPAECLRNSSCTCRQCDPSATPAPLARQRQMKPAPAADTTVDQSSLILLKSKMSRRKSRSAPTNAASMFVEEDKPRQTMHSARDPPTKPLPVRAPPARVVQEDPPMAASSNVFSGVPDGESEVQDDGANHTCPDCQRRFNATAFAKHQKPAAKPAAKAAPPPKAAAPSKTKKK